MKALKVIDCKAVWIMAFPFQYHIWLNIHWKKYCICVATGQGIWWNVVFSKFLCWSKNLKCLSRVGCHYNMVQYQMVLHSPLHWLGQNMNQFTKLASGNNLMGELWGVFYEDFSENWPRYNSTALYYRNLCWPDCCSSMAQLILLHFSRQPWISFCFYQKVVQFKFW